MLYSYQKYLAVGAGECIIEGIPSLDRKCVNEIAVVSDIAVVWVQLSPRPPRAWVLNE